ncbi:UNVERIFIED_CONTAM: WD repeat-containing protein 4 [Siphonaria sp. JEL0065]|nr:WD repeat-containing protein 4 [Siphonaria sp. JEL0065]
MPTSIHLVAYSKDLVIAAYGSRFIAVDAKTNQLVAAPNDHPSSNESSSVEKLKLDAMPEGLIRAIVFHRNGELMAVASDSRTIQVWNIKTWTLVQSKMLIKRPNALAFSGSEDELGDLIVADKFGDVYRIPLGSVNDKIKLLLGHCSLVTDMLLSHENGFLITSDRDEKIRVSLFPDTFEIDGFCLGHTGFITKICPVPNRPNAIISGGGDGNLILWNLTTHTEVERLAIADFAPELRPINATTPQTIVTIKSSPVSSAIAILFENIPLVTILRASLGSNNKFEVHTNIQLPRAALDIEFDHKGDLIVAFAPAPTQFEDSLLIGISEFHKEKEVKFSEISTTAGVAGKLNQVGTSETTEKVDYGAYIQILRKFNEEEYRELKKKRKSEAGEDGEGGGGRVPKQQKQQPKQGGGKGKGGKRGGKNHKKNQAGGGIQEEPTVADADQ